MRYIWDGKHWVPRENYASPVQAGPSIIRDETDAFTSMADGQVYTSKSSYRRELKAHGMVEYGNDRDSGRKIEPSSAIPELSRLLD
jgi:hypothetical protein